MVANPSKYLYDLFDLTLSWQVYIVGALAMPISSLLCSIVWSLQNWKHHPILSKLKHVAPDESQAAVVAAQINVEVRRPGQFREGYYSQKVQPLCFDFCSTCYCANRFIMYIYVYHVFFIGLCY